MARGMAQSSSPFEGTVHDASGQPLYGANVVLYADGGKLLAFAVVGRDGHFSLKRLPGADHLTVSFMGYKSVTLPVAGFRRWPDSGTGRTSYWRKRPSNFGKWWQSLNAFPSEEIR